MRFSESLERRMKDRCETKYALAKAIGVEQSTIANWLKGVSTPRLGNIGRLAEHYGCRPDEIEKEIREETG